MLADDAYFLLSLTLSMVLTSFLTLCFASLFFFIKDRLSGSSNQGFNIISINWRPNQDFRPISINFLQNNMIFKKERVDWKQEGF
jgi:hypothetical protein